MMAAYKCNSCLNYFPIPKRNEAAEMKFRKQFGEEFEINLDKVLCDRCFGAEVPALVGRAIKELSE